MVLPVSIGVMALGIDVSYWSVVRVRCQAIADAAAMAGGERYAESGSASAALSTAANVAELDGVTPGTRSGQGNTLVDSSASWTASFLFNATNNQLTATISTSAPIFFGKIFTTANSQTITAAAVAQITPRTSGPAACIIGLSGEATGVTTLIDLHVSGSTSVNSNTCGLRSDGEISLTGSSGINVASLYASGGIYSSGSASVTCTGGTSSCEWGTAPQESDPLANKYGSLLTIPPGSGASQGSGTTLSPGTYSSLSFGGNQPYTLSPGTYYVQSTISFQGSVTVNGTGVTLISGGGISFSGNATINLSAPTSGSTAGLLYGTSSSSASVSWRGTSNNTLVGAIYAPNATVTYIGDSSVANGPGSCTEVVASTVQFSGNSSLSSSGCSGAGVPSLYMLPGRVQLVQ